MGKNATKYNFVKNATDYFVMIYYSFSKSLLVTLNIIYCYTNERLTGADRADINVVGY
jgi:hypothetical protein